MDELEDEVCAINSIYEGCMTEWGPSIYDIRIPDCQSVLRLSFPSAYPAVPPKIMAVVQGPGEVYDFENVLRSCYVTDEVVVFDLLERCRELVDQLAETEEASQATEPEVPVGQVDIFKGWTASEPVVDRKSVFIARAAKVTSAEEALDKIALLKYDKRIAKATHNITAYRIQRDDGIMIQDCDDDGEDAAGGRLMHLLNLTQSCNVVVVVSRWYGGIKLGADRFKHINSSARDALVLGGFIPGK